MLVDGDALHSIKTLETALEKSRDPGGNSAPAGSDRQGDCKALGGDSHIRMTRPIPKRRISLSTDPKRIRSGNWLLSWQVYNREIMGRFRLLDHPMWVDLLVLIPVTLYYL